MAAAVLGVVGVTGLTTGTVSAQSNNRSFPTSVSDCADWRRFGNDFRNRGDCVSWVQSHNGHGNHNGYGGGNGGGNGGGIGQVVRSVLSFLTSLIQQLFAFLGRLF